MYPDKASVTGREKMHCAMYVCSNAYAAVVQKCVLPVVLQVPLYPRQLLHIIIIYSVEGLK